jgi:hypothetical protein
MIFPDVPIEEWRKKHNLPKAERDCAKCRKRFELSVPILMQGCAGVSTPIHECGEGYCSVLLTPKTDKAKEFWMKVLA